jgi:cell wall-associated NlpC family hydrolase
MPVCPTMTDLYSAVLSYASTLIGVPYRWYREGDPIQGDDKFWATNGPPVSRAEIDKQDKCIVCTGLINLMRRFVGLPIPGLDGSLNDIGGDRYPGTTSIWFAHLARTGRLEPLDVANVYPHGTLLLANFQNVETDQGHVAVVLGDQQILHAYPEIAYKDSQDLVNVGKTAITSFHESHFWVPGGYYTHVCLPEHWLS